MYLTLICILGVLLFVVGLGMPIYGCRKYDFHPLALLVPFVGALFSFPVYFALKERSLKKAGATDGQLKNAHRQTILGLAFVVAFFVVLFVVGVCFFARSMDVLENSGTVDAAAWARWTFWGMAAVCAAYAVALFSSGCRKEIAV